MNKKKLRMIFTMADLTEELIHKDVGNLIKYLKITNKNKIETELAYLNNNKTFNDTQFVKFKKIKSFLVPFCRTHFINRNFPMLLNTIINAKKIDILMLFHLTNISALFGIIYKFINKRGKLYIKLDMDQRFFDYKPSKISYFLLNKFLENSDVISIESEEMHSGLTKKDKFYGVKIKDKLIKIPNAFDENYFKEQNIKIKDFSEKDNIILTIGRLGTFQKNTEMFLEVIKSLNLQDWKVYCVGTIEDSFQVIIESFFKENPSLKQSVFFTGPISDKKELFELYNRSKIFSLTSRFEGFATVFAEAIYFGNTVVTTNVNGAIEATDNNKLGYITNNCAQEFTEKLEYLINHQEILENNYLKLIPYARKKFTWSSVIKNDKFIELLGLKDE